MKSIPSQLIPVINFSNVTDGNGLTEYVRDYHLKNASAMSEDNSVSTETKKVIMNYVPKNIQIPLEIHDAIRKHFTEEQQTALEKRQRILIGTIEKCYYIPEGEKIYNSYITVLANNSYGFAAGTIVYVRETNKAVINFILHNLRLNYETAEIEVSNMFEPTDKSNEQIPVSLSVSSTASSIIESALQVSQCLVWALPHPWGAITAAGLTLFEILFNGQSSENPYDIMVKELEAYANQHDINGWTRTINELSSWMLTQQASLKLIKGSEREYILQNLLPELRRQTAPGGQSVYDAISGLSDNQYISTDGVFDVLVAGISVYLLALKMIIQLDALVASGYEDAENTDMSDSYNNLWRGDYINFLINISGSQDPVVQGWAAKIASRAEKFKTDRLSQITGTYRYSHTRSYVEPATKELITVTESGWTFIDHGASDRESTHSRIDTTSGGCCGSTIEHRDEVESARAAYVKNISDQLDAKYGGSLKAAQKWAASIQEWNQHLPPLKPQKKVSINNDGWGDKVPQGSDWVVGNAVSYALAYANASGPSPMGSWSEYFEIKNKAFPSLNIPVDMSQMGTARWIYRRFKNGTTKTMLVGIVADNSTTSYQDKKK